MFKIIPFEEKYALRAKELVFDIFKDEFPMIKKMIKVTIGSH